MEEDVPQQRQFGTSDLNLKALAKDLRLDETASRGEILAKARETLSVFRAMFGSLSVAIGSDQQEDNKGTFHRLLKLIDEAKDNKERVFPIKVVKE